MSQEKLDKYFDEFLALEPAPTFKELTDLIKNINPLPSKAMDLWQEQLDELLQDDSNSEEVKNLLSHVFIFGLYKPKEIAERLITMDIDRYTIDMILYEYPEYEEQLLPKYEAKDRYLYLMKKAAKDIE